MRKLALTGGATLAAAALTLAAPAAAFAGDRFDDDGLVVDLDTAVAAGVDLDQDTALSSCFGNDRNQVVTVVDRDRDTRTVHCVSADTAADLDAEIDTDLDADLDTDLDLDSVIDVR